jgi:pimeloyl-ACP methyl ester carboxylesterase
LPATEETFTSAAAPGPDRPSHASVTRRTLAAPASKPRVPPDRAAHAGRARQQAARTAGSRRPRPPASRAYRRIAPPTLLIVGAEDHVDPLGRLEMSPMAKPCET